MDEQGPREVVCPAGGGKVRHASRAAARAALADARAVAGARRHRKLPRTVYRCRICDGGWHLTSQSRRQYLMWPGRHRHT